MVNHIGLFLVPFCSGFCSGFLVISQPQAQNAKRWDVHMVCLISYLTYLSLKVDMALRKGVGPQIAHFTVLEEVTKCTFRNSRQYGEDWRVRAHTHTPMHTHARAHTHKEAFWLKRKWSFFIFQIYKSCICSVKGKASSLKWKG